MSLKSLNLEIFYLIKTCYIKDNIFSKYILDYLLQLSVNQLHYLKVIVVSLYIDIVYTYHNCEYKYSLRIFNYN